MKKKSMAGFALLLGIVMLGAFISGCISQDTTTSQTSTRETTTEPTKTTTSEQTQTSTPTQTTTPEPTQTTTPTQTQTETQTPDLETEEKELTSLIEVYDAGIMDAKEKLAKTGFELDSPEIQTWEESSKELREMIKNESDAKTRILMLNDLAKLRYYELANMRSLAGIGAIEREYWENATTGKPIEAFYNARGSFFYVSGGKVEELSREGIVKRMSKVKGYQLESLEIYHFGTGSALRAIREGGRTVGAGVVSIRVGAKNGAVLRFNSTDLPVLRLIDPTTGEVVMRIQPNEDGNYEIPPLNTTLLGVADLEGLKKVCKPLPTSDTILTPMPIEEEPLLCPSAGIAPFILEPTTGPYNPVPPGEFYLLPNIHYETKTSAIEVGVPKEGVKLQIIPKGGKIVHMGNMVLTDPKTGEQVAVIKPGENWTFTIPPIDGEVIGNVTAETDPPGTSMGGFCYRHLPLHIETTLQPIEVCEQEFVLNMMPIIFQPSDNITIQSLHTETARISPAEYTITGLEMKADLKELAEQLVNINARVGETRVVVDRPTKALDAFQGVITKTLKAEMSTPAESCSCTVSPFLNGVLKRAFGEPFGEVPEMRKINITDYGTGPYLPVAWEKLENYSSTVTVYVISGNGETLIAIGDPGVKQGTKRPSSNRIAIGDPGVKEGTKKPSASRLANNYLDRVYIEVFTGRNAAGERIKVIAFKVLNTDGTVGIRTTAIVKDVDIKASLAEPTVIEES